MTSFPVGDHAGFDHTTTDLVVVDHHKLWQGDAIEAAKLYSACVDRGFFYLDLENGSSDSTLQNVDQLFQVTKEYFAMPLDQKMKDTRSEIDVFHICGYAFINYSYHIVYKFSNSTLSSLTATSLLVLTKEMFRARRMAVRD